MAAPTTLSTRASRGTRRRSRGLLEEHPGVDPEGEQAGPRAAGGVERQLQLAPRGAGVALSARHDCPRAVTPASYTHGMEVR